MLSRKMAPSDALVFKLALQKVTAVRSRFKITKNRKHFFYTGSLTFQRGIQSNKIIYIYIQFKESENTV